MRLGLVTIPFASILVIAACSSDESSSGPACSDYTPPASFDSNAPVATFSKDVFPLFKTCGATTSCHNAANATIPLQIGTTAATVHAALVNIPSTKLPAMVYVKPGDARESFLMRKLDGSHCVLDAQCVGKTCGDQMPNKEAQLSLAERDGIRRWIAQGAKND